MANSTTKCALITGGTSGIGLELARLFAKDGYNLVIIARDETELQKAAQELKSESGIQVTTIAKDLFKGEAPKEIYDEVHAKGLQVDVLVNDAGQGEYGFFHETAIERDLNIIQLNIVSLVHLTKLFLQDMIARGEGKILNLASIAGRTPTPLLGVYAATKAFVYSFSESLHSELKDRNITVTALLPGATDTDFFNKAGMLNTKEYHEHLTGDPVQVAKDGYEALMKGEDKIVSGMKNKMMTGMGNVMPDAMLADNMRKNHMQNIDGTEGKEGASRSEGERMAASNPNRNEDNPGPATGGRGESTPR